MAAFQRKRKKDDRKVRIAIVDANKCKPTKCQQECRKFCPVNQVGKQCISVKRSSKLALISETMCTGCGACVKKCPFDAIRIINLPTGVPTHETTHRYGPNAFKLHRLPVPRANHVLGLVGQNGIGKSTALRILGGQLMPNLGHYADDDEAPAWPDVIRYFRGSTLQGYFQQRLEQNLTTIVKPQWVDLIKRALHGTVRACLEPRDQRHCMDTLVRDLDLTAILDRDITQLSGGELQRVAIAVVCMRKANVYMFDEPSSYLDIRQRLAAANVIRRLALAQQDHYVVVVEHDLALLDYLSDEVCLLYGEPGAYGVVTKPGNTRDSINHFLDGYIPAENMRFRKHALSFQWHDAPSELVATTQHDYTYPRMVKTFGAGFQLQVEAGQFRDASIVVLLGQNGTGKSTFIQLLARRLAPDDATTTLPTSLSVSYKPQNISPRFPGTVRALFARRLGALAQRAAFKRDLVVPLGVEALYDQSVRTLSGGELQRVAVCLALGVPADVYLIDEPSAYLDSEQRMAVAKVLKRFVMHRKKTAFVVEHDMMMATYLADRVMVFDGEPSIGCAAHAPQPLVAGMNRFLRTLGITLRRDATHGRPRINKLDSVKDVAQKKSGQYFAQH